MAHSPNVTFPAKPELAAGERGSYTFGSALNHYDELERWASEAQRALSAVMEALAEAPHVPSDVVEFGRRNKIESFAEATYLAAHADTVHRIAKALRTGVSKPEREA